MCEQDDIIVILTRRKWRWVGHILRKDMGNIMKEAFFLDARWEKEAGKTQDNLEKDCSTRVAYEQVSFLGKSQLNRSNSLQSEQKGAPSHVLKLSHQHGAIKIAKQSLFSGRVHV